LQLFHTPLAFNALVGPGWSVPIGITGKSLVLRKLESWGYQAVKTVDRLSRFEMIPACDGQSTDRA